VYEAHRGIEARAVNRIVGMLKNQRGSALLMALGLIVAITLFGFSISSLSKINSLTSRDLDRQFAVASARDAILHLMSTRTLCQAALKTNLYNDTAAKSTDGLAIEFGINDLPVREGDVFPNTDLRVNKLRMFNSYPIATVIGTGEMDTAGNRIIHSSIYIELQRVTVQDTDIQRQSHLLGTISMSIEPPPSNNILACWGERAPESVCAAIGGMVNQTAIPPCQLKPSMLAQDCGKDNYIVSISDHGMISCANLKP
jgi:hypothetical protein